MTHNPFTPPATPVADLPPEVAVAPQRPWQVRLAVWICFLSAASQLPALFFLVPGWLQQGYAPLYVALNALIVVCVFVALAAMYVFIYRRHRWARLLYVALVLLDFAFAYKLAPGRLAAGWYWASTYLFVIAADLVNLVLLLSPASNAWFRDQPRG
jgi:hypothetical protein